MIFSTAILSLSMVVYHRVMSEKLGDQYGDLFALHAIINILAVATLGIGANFTKVFAKIFETEGNSAVVRTFNVVLPVFWRYTLLASFGLILTGFWLVEYLKIDDFSLVVLTVGLFASGLAAQVYRAPVQGMHRFGYVGGSLVVEGLGRIFFGAGFVFFGLGAIGALAGSMLALILAAALPWYCLWVCGRDKSNHGKAHPGAFRGSLELGKDSLSLIFFSVMCYLDAVVTKHYFSDQLVTLPTGLVAERAAVFARVMLVAKSFLYFTLALNMLVLPLVSAAKAGGRDPRRVLLKYVLVSAAGLLAGLLAVFWKTAWVVQLLCGTDLHVLEQLELVRYLCAAYLVLALVQVLVYYHVAMATSWLWWFSGVMAVSYYLLLANYHESEYQVVWSLAGVSTAFLLVAIVGAIKLPATLGFSANKISD